jgi:Domain of unknown function (DUF5916)
MFFAMLGLALSAAAAAGTTARVDAVALTAASDAVRVDGELNSTVWEKVPPTIGFVQREPNDGGEPSQRTEFRVAYDATTLFVRVRAFDTEPGKIITYLTRRDNESPGDWLRILIDSYHDRRTAYEFGVNPSGVKIDRYWFDDTRRDDSWDAVWDVTVSRDPEGWSAEFRIPFSQLRFNPAQTNTFGLAVTRDIGRLKETSTWPLLSRSANGYVSSFGELGGLSMEASIKRVELVPYMVTNLTREMPDGNPLVKRSDPGAAVGLDVKYALTPGLTFTGSVNPDFGQVEADPAVVNLTAFETFFTERRPFFVEGSGTFNFGLDCSDGQCTGLFYSRRIGRAPQGVDDLDTGEAVHTASPVYTSILGAGKLTGRVGRYSIGVMQAFTQEEFARVQDGLVQTRTPIEPSTSYTVGRVRREFSNQSSIGGMFTATKRDNTLQFLPETALATGLDWDLRFKTRYSLTGYMVRSDVHGEPEAIERVQENSRHYYQRPDMTSESLDPTRRSISGTAGNVGISKIGGKYVRFNSNVGFKSPGFEINDLGFLRRADQRNIGNWIQFRNDTPNRWFRSRMINFNQYASWNYDGDVLESGGNVNAHATWVNKWEMGGGYNFNALEFDDRATRGGPGVYNGGSRVGWHYLNTDPRRQVKLSYFIGGGGNGEGQTFLEFNPSVTYRPLPALTINPGLRYLKNAFGAQWVEKITDTSDHYVFGDLDQTTVALTTRVNYTLTPNLSLELYAEPFVSAGDFGSFKELVNGRARAFADRYGAYDYHYAPGDDPDFNVKSFRTTNVLRWEYKPGSTLFVVWQQARENDYVPGGFRFRRDVHDIFGVTPRNTFLVKLAYWLNY